MATDEEMSPAEVKRLHDLIREAFRTGEIPEHVLKVTPEEIAKLDPARVARLIEQAKKGDL